MGVGNDDGALRGQGELAAVGHRLEGGGDGRCRVARGLRQLLDGDEDLLAAIHRLEVAEEEVADSGLGIAAVVVCTPNEAAVQLGTAAQ